MKRIMMISLVIVLLVSMVPAALAQYDVSLKGDYWFWSGDFAGISVDGGAFVLGATCSVWDNIDLEYKGIFGNVSTIFGYPLDGSGLAIKPVTNIFKLNYWLGPNLYVNLGYADKVINIVVPDTTIGLLGFKGFRFGIGGEYSFYNGWKVFGDFGVAPCNVSLLNITMSNTSGTMTDLQLGLSYEISQDLSFRGGYMYQNTTVEDLESTIGGLFFGASYEL
ncbi:MAG: hypothetical protein UMV23_06235 [Halanaerobium sp.]|nr:hypothetical protein [Halanaerobium sp.]